MKRDEALSLLKELMIVYANQCGLRPLHLLMPGANLEHWKLNVKWVNYDEKGCFDKIINERGLMVAETGNGCTIFQKPWQSQWL